MMLKTDKIMKMRISAFAAALLLFMCCFMFASHGAEYANPQTGYRAIVDDAAGLLSDSEKTELLEKMKGITEYCGAMLKTTGENASAASVYAEQVFIETFGRDNGVLFLIDMDNRELYIFSGGYAYTVITTPYANTITDNVYTYASRGEYYNCAANAFAQMETLLAGGRIAQPMKYITNALIAGVGGILITFIIMVSQRRKVQIDSTAVKKGLVAASVVTLAGLTVNNVRKVANITTSSGSSGSSGGSSWSFSVNLLM